MSPRLRLLESVLRLFPWRTPAYGAMPGWGNYDARMDFCGHFKIDIADLSTVAANM